MIQAIPPAVMPRTKVADRFEKKAAGVLASRFSVCSGGGSGRDEVPVGRRVTEGVETVDTRSVEFDEDEDTEDTEEIEAESDADTEKLVCEVSGGAVGAGGGGSEGILELELGSGLLSCLLTRPDAGLA